MRLQLQITALMVSFTSIISLGYATEEGRMMQIVPPEATVHKHEHIPMG